MNILFDLSGCNQPYNAITVYGLRILAGFKENGYKDISILCDARIYDHVHVTFPEYPCLEIAFDTGRNPMTLLRNFRHWKNTVKNIEHDVLFVPHVFPPNFCFHRRDKTVLVLHDLQGLRIYKGLRLWACRFFYPLALWRCKASIVISDFVREDVRKTYPFISPRKLNTIYNGVVVDQLPQKRDTLPVKGKYLLYVSSLMEHKNVMTLLRAFNRLKDKIPHTLVIIGKTRPVWTEKALPFIQEENLSSRIYHVTKPVSDETLAQYYNQADLFIHPSLMEGFGNTPIEAAIYGTPVLTNKETALFETTMGLLNYYEPATDDKAMANEIERLLTNPISLDRLSEIASTFRERYDNTKQGKKIYDLLISLSMDSKG